MILVRKKKVGITPVALGDTLGAGPYSGGVWSSTDFDLAADDNYILAFSIRSDGQDVNPTMTIGGQATTPGPEIKSSSGSTDIHVHYILAANLPSPGLGLACSVTWPSSPRRGSFIVAALKGAKQQAPIVNGSTDVEGPGTATNPWPVSLAAGSAAFLGLMVDDGDSPVNVGGSATVIANIDEPLNDRRNVAAYLLNQSGSIDIPASWSASVVFLKAMIGIEPL